MRARLATMAPRKRRLFVIGLGAAIAVATLLVLTLVPIPQTFSMHGAAVYDLETTCTGIDTTRGTNVNFHWSASGWTYFSVGSCSSNQLVYEANGTQGSGSFIANGGVYEFGSDCPGSGPCYPADMAGTFTGPLLPL